MDDDGEPMRLEPNPLTRDEIGICMEHGLVSACRKGLLDAGKLFKLAHSIEGLTEFAYALAETSPERMASCWTSALDTPFDILGMNFEDAWECAEKETANRTDVKKKSYILYIDDVPAEADAVTEIFKSRFRDRYRVRGFTSPSEALDFIESKKLAGQNVAVVVTDMYMPQEFHGDELAQRLLLIDPYIPVLGYSGHNRFQDPEPAKKAGLVDLLSKQSTDTNVLLDTVDSLLCRQSA